MPHIFGIHPGEYRAIIHVDADAFFASCEQAMDHRLKGRPVVTGKERGIASAASYEAKAKGVKRAMPIHEIMRICPDCVYLPSDYETYSLFSTRMFDIVRRYTTQVEEYGIDECFADLTGLRRPLKMKYPAIAQQIKKDIERELDITVSVGLAPTKVLAKIGSKWDKPSGFTVIGGRTIPDYLDKIIPRDIWGIGEQTHAYLKKQGVSTALDLAKKDEWWISKRLSKPYREIWRELRGELVNEVNPEKKEQYKSISKTKTFTPPSSNRNFVFAQLSKNIENACIKLRRYRLATDRVFVYLKTREFRIYGLEIRLSSRVNTPLVILGEVEKMFDTFFRKNIPYRATGVVLLHLGESAHQQDLFGEQVSVEKQESVFETIDKLDHRFGKHTVFLGSSFQAVQGKSHLGFRGDKPERLKEPLKGETERKHLAVPIIGEVI